MADDAHAIDATFQTVSVGPVPPDPPPDDRPDPEDQAPEVAGQLSRADLLRIARLLAAQVNGLAGIVEMATLAPESRVRREFVDVWRKWCGAWIGYHMRLERMPCNPDDESKRVAHYAGRLQEWRRALRAELTAAGVAVGLSPAAPAAVAPAVPMMQPHWPWWATLGVAGGLAYGAYRGIEWLIGRWSGESTEPAPTP